MTLLESIPVFRETNVGLEEFRTVYDIFQCVCFERPSSSSSSSKQQQQQQRRAPPLRRDDDDDDGESPPGRKRKRRAALAVSGNRDEGIPEAIRRAYESASPRDRESWNVESGDPGSDPAAAVAVTSSPSGFFAIDTMTNRDEPSSSGGGGRRRLRRGYCSFLLRDDSDSAVTRFSETVESLMMRRESGNVTAADDDPSKVIGLPRSLLSPAKKAPEEAATAETRGGDGVRLAPHYWIFAGYNPLISCGNDDDDCNDGWLSGRPEHTDSIEGIDGTFHHQLLGGKTWRLRPTRELRDRCDGVFDRALLDRYEIHVEEGDVLVVNTRLWWHSTAIPPSGWSVSYARDLRLDDGDGDTAPAPSAAVNDDGTDRRRRRKASNGDEPTDPADFEVEEEEEEGVDNVEVSWASGFIPRGTTLVVADDVADERDGEEEGKVVDAASSLCRRFVPPTIRRTTLPSESNCKLVVAVLSPSSPDREEEQEEQEQEDDDDDDEGRVTSAVATTTTTTNNGTHRAPQRRFRIAMEAVRDIREGEEFRLFVASYDDDPK